MLTTNPIPNLISGVSQQADSMKFPSQAVEQVNAVSHIVEGLVKRPPTNHVSRVVIGDLGNCKVHPINRDSTQRYFAVFKSNSVAVFDAADGSQKPVNFDGAAEAYLTTSTPETTLEALSIADYTFVLNKSIVPELDAEETDALPTDSLVVVKRGDYGKTYTIKVGGVVFATCTTSDTDPGETATDFIAAALKTSWDSGSGHPGYTCTRSGSTLLIEKATGDYVIDLEDGFGGDGLILVKGSVRSFTELPLVAPHGFKVKVAGEPESESDDYWVEFVTPNGAVSPDFTGGRWVESIAPEVQYITDASTMPHVLVRETDGTFTFREADWVDRLVGDDETSAAPSFFGKTIQNLVFFRNRLGFLADENIVLSEAGNFFNFWRTTVVSILDSDPIDVGVSHNQVSILYHAVPFFDQLLLMGEKAQFALKGGQESLTSKNVAITAATEIDINPAVAPRLAGKNLYLGFGRNQYSGVWEYFVAPDTDRLDAEDVTIGVPSYIAGSLKELAVSESEKVLFARSDANPAHLYLYKYYTNGGERVQSAWSRWEFEDAAEIKGMAVFGSSLYLMVYRAGDGLSLERMDLQSGLKDDYSDYTILLDRKFGEGLTGTYNSDTDKTTFYLPYGVVDDSLFWAVTRFTELYSDGGSRMVPESVGTDGVVVFDGDVSAIPMWFGLNYVQTYTMSKPYLRPAQGSNRIAVGRRYQIRRGLVSYHNTLAFKVKVTPEFRAPFTHVFTGKIFGTPLEEVGSQTPVSGAFPFSVMTQNTQLTVQLINDLPFPSALTTVDWIGDFVPYGRN